MARKRRGRGEGSISQRADGVWEAKVSLGYDGTGKRRRKTVYGQTKQEVQDKLRELQNNVGKGISIDGKQLTVEAWLTRWLAMVKPTVEPNTYAPYERHVRLHLTPHIGGVKLAKMTAMDMKGLYAALTAGGVSAALQRKVGTTLTIALNQAVRLDLIPSNAALKIRKPKATKPEIEVLDRDQVARFLTTARTSRYYPLYLTAIDSGARPGELFALAWPDVDFDAGFISITKSLEDLEGVLRVKAVKTPRSRRRIDLSSQTMAALADHRKAMLAAGFINGPVFCDTAGGHLRISNLHRTSFKPLLKQANLPSVKLYALRHTSATLLLEANQPVKVISERLGHSSAMLTLDTYAHVLPAMQRRAADTMGQLLGPGSAGSEKKAE